LNLASGNADLIVLSGCSGGGKSTLLAEMARRGFQVREEAGRRVVREQMSIGGNALPWKDVLRFVELATWRAAKDFQTARLERRPVLFDRSVVDVVSDLDFKNIDTPPSLSRMLRACRYASEVFMVPPWRVLFQTDAERQKSFDEAKAEYLALVAAYRRLGYRVTEIPRKAVTERADFLVERIGRNAP